MGEAQASDNEPAAVEWIPARHALGLAVKALADTEKAEAEIIRLAAAGLINSRAGWAWVDYGLGESGSREDWPLPEAFWIGTKDDPDFLSLRTARQDSWSEGNFTRRVARDRLETSYKVEASRVEFFAPDLLTWFPSSNRRAEPSQVTETVKKKGAGGAPKDVVSWTAFWHAIIQLAADQRLTKFNFPAPKDLRDEILGMIGEGISDRTIRGEANQVYRRFIDASTKDDE